MSLSSCTLASHILCNPARRRRFQDLYFSLIFDSLRIQLDETDICSFLGIFDASLERMAQGPRLTPIPLLLRDLTLHIMYTPSIWRRAERSPPIYSDNVVALLTRMHGEDWGIRSFIFLHPYTLTGDPDYSWKPLSATFKQAFWDIIVSTRLQYVGLQCTHDLPSNLFHSSPILHLELVDVRFQTTEQMPPIRALHCRDRGQYPLLETINLKISWSHRWKTLKTYQLPLPLQLEHPSSGRVVFPYRTIKSFAPDILTFEQIDAILQTNDGSLEVLAIEDRWSSK